MTCNRIRRKLSAFLDGELPAAEARRIEQHLAGCAGCGREARLLTATYQLLALCPPALRLAVPPARRPVGLKVPYLRTLVAGPFRLAICRASLPIVTGLLSGALLGLWLWPRLSPADSAPPPEPRRVYERNGAAFGALARDPLEEAYVTLAAAPRR
jgi:anti-sigma factor RsiW